MVICYWRADKPQLRESKILSSLGLLNTVLLEADGVDTDEASCLESLIICRNNTRFKIHSQVSTGLKSTRESIEDSSDE